MVKALSCDNAASVCGGTVYIVHCPVRNTVVQWVMTHTKESQVYTVSPTADYHFLLDCVCEGVGKRRQQLWKDIGALGVDPEMASSVAVVTA